MKKIYSYMLYILLIFVFFQITPAYSYSKDSYKSCYEDEKCRKNAKKYRKSSEIIKRRYKRHSKFVTSPENRARTEKALKRIRERRKKRSY